ncbi:MAG: hypothetical protein ACRC6I_10740 [Paracoccaceae bacterium]
MRISLVLLMFAASPALADDWATLKGNAITSALTDRLLTYADGARQQFNAGGTTLYENPAPSTGQWRVEGDRYCSQWPPSDRWTCYDVAANGLDLRFVADDGSITEGRYADLR